MSANAKEGGVRIVKKHKKGHGGGHHGGAWKVAYADFVTAMMAFFLVMWIVGLNTAVKEAVASYFKDPIGFMKSEAKGKMPIAVNDPGILNAPKVSPDLLKNSPANGKGKSEERQMMERAKTALNKVIRQSPEFKLMSGSIRVTIANDGLRIDLVETHSDLFFDSGSATTKPRTRQLLKKIADELGQLPSKIVIEGHTDSRAYSGPNGWTNWELSTARANAARSVMEASGLQYKQIIEVRGLADTVPIDPVHRDSFKNRRVSILIPFRDTTERIGLPKQADPHEAKTKSSTLSGVGSSS